MGLKIIRLNMIHTGEVACIYTDEEQVDNVKKYITQWFKELNENKNRDLSDWYFEDIIKYLEEKDIPIYEETEIDIDLNEYEEKYKNDNKHR